MSTSKRPKSIRIDPATPGDVPEIHRLIHLLAEYEKAPQDCVATVEMVHEQLFGPNPVAKTVMARIGGRVAGFALYYRSFSTWLAKPGLYLEDLFVISEYRGMGIGTALLKHLAGICESEGYGRMEWSCLEWNELAKCRYRAIGAQPMEEWRVWRLAGDGLRDFAKQDEALELPLSIDTVDPVASTESRPTPEGATIKIYTDGGCRPNPGVGAWAAVLINGDHIKELVGGETETTNNRMELSAAIESLEALKRPCLVEMHTDSQYVKKGITTWIKGWKAKNWMRGKEGPVKNVDLWKRLDAATHKHTVAWKWVRGHAGNKYNEVCDELCSEEIDRLTKLKKGR